MVAKTYDLIIIGGGFWGVATAILATERGLDTLILDDGNPKSASRNAAGIVCRHWYKQRTILNMMPSDWTQRDIDEGVDFLQRFELKKTGEEFTSYARTDGKLRPDCYLVPSCKIVTSAFPTKRAIVRRLTEATKLVVVTSDSEKFLARNVVVAAGAYTDDLLKISGLPTVGVKPLRGRALVAKVPEELEIPWTHMTRPYTHYTLRSWPNQTVRLGDTVERTLGKGEEALTPLRSLLKTMSPHAKESQILDGLRPVVEKFVVRNISSRIIAATGGHRVGLGLAGVAAKKALDLILKTKKHP